MKKSKKLPVILGIIAALVVVVAVAFACFGARIVNFAMKTFKSDAGYLEWVIDKNVMDTATEMISLVSEKAIEGMTASSTGAQGSVELNISEPLVEAISERAGMDLECLSNAKISCSRAVDDTQMGASYEIVLNGYDFISFDVLDNREEGRLYVTFPDLEDGSLYMEYDVEDGKTLSIARDSLKEALPYAGDVAKGLLKAANAGIKTIENVEIQGNSQETVSGITQSLTKIEVTMDGETYSSIYQAMADSLNDNEEFKTAVGEFLNALTKAGMEDMVGELPSADDYVQALISTLEEAANTARDSEDVHVLCIYVDNEGKLRGASFKDESGDEAFEFITATEGEGKDTGLLLDVNFKESGEFTLEGQGGVSGDLFSGEYKLSIAGQDAAYIYVDDLDTTDGYVNGKLTCTVEDYIATLWELDITEDSYIEFHVASSKADTTLPKLSDNLYNFDDDEKLIEYLNALDQDKLDSDLLSAGLPEELINSVSEIEGLLEQ